MGGIDPQTPRDWGHGFSRLPLMDCRCAVVGPQPCLSRDQRIEPVASLRYGRSRHWRLGHWRRGIAERFGVYYHERDVSTLFPALGFSYVSAQLQYPVLDAEVVAASKISAHLERSHGPAGIR